MSSYHVSSQHIQELLGAFFKHENAVFNGEQETKSICCVRVGKKICPSDHSLSSLGKPRDAKQWSSVQVFLSYPHILIYDRFF